jgi:hypothetical protein
MEKEVETKDTFRCDDCEKEFIVGEESKENLLETSTGLKSFCDNCAKNYHECVMCGEYLHENSIDLTQNNDGDYYCQNCYDDNYMRCYSCDCEMLSEEAYYSDRQGEYLCRSCYAEENGGLPERAVNVRTTSFQSKEKGDIIVSPRKFGVEIECGSERPFRFASALEELPLEVGMCQDGSLSGFENLIEIQTPPASGKAGEKLIKDVCATLRRGSAKVNDSCGLHVHLECKDILAESSNATKQSELKTKSLFALYFQYEDVIQSFLPSKRRTNRFAMPLAADYSLANLQMVKAQSDLEALWYYKKLDTGSTDNTILNGVSSCKEHKKHQSRYHGINFHSLYSWGVLEIRYHQGTTNPEKILNWINLHQLIIDYVAKQPNNKIVKQLLKDVPDNLADKTQLLFKSIGMSKDSIKYFLERQKKFAQPNLTTKCVE